MADKKISALTAASTPLAGTEVLPIVQSGATVKVAVFDLTTNRTVVCDTLIANNTTGPDTTNFKITSYGASNAGVAIQNSTGWSGISMSGGDVYFDINRSGSAANLYFRNGSTFTEVARIDSSNNFKVTAGNLVIGTSGKGVNFTANTPAAGMTSQLLNWYEEGTWTPSVSSAVGSITTVGAVSGTYTRIGRLCTLTFDVAITTNGTGSSSINMAGAPFTALVGSFGSGGEVNLTGKQLEVQIATGGTTVNFAYYDASYPGANGTRFKGTLTYPI